MKQRAHPSRTHGEGERATSTTSLTGEVVKLERRDGDDGEAERLGCRSRTNLHSYSPMDRGPSLHRLAVTCVTAL